MGGPLRTPISSLAGGSDFRTVALTAAVAFSGAFLGTVAALGRLIAVLHEVAVNVFVGEAGTRLSAGGG